MKDSELDARADKLEKMMKHPSAGQVPAVVYEELFWWMIGVLSAADAHEHLDDWTAHCIHYALDRIELEVKTH